MRKLQERIAKEKNKSKIENDDYYINDTKHKIEEMNKYKENKDEIKKIYKKKKIIIKNQNKKKWNKKK